MCECLLLLLILLPRELQTLGGIILVLRREYLLGLSLFSLLVSCFCRPHVPLLWCGSKAHCSVSLGHPSRGILYNRGVLLAFFGEIGDKLFWCQSDVPPTPLTPPMGVPKYICWGYYWLTILIPMESNIFGKLLTSNIMLFIPEEYPDPPSPYPPRRQKGGPCGILPCKLSITFYLHSL